MERVVENPANPLRGRERGGFDNSPNWEKADRPIVRGLLVVACVIFVYSTCPADFTNRLCTCFQ